MPEVLGMSYLDQPSEAKLFGRYTTLTCPIASEEDVTVFFQTWFRKIFSWGCRRKGHRDSSHIFQAHALVANPHSPVSATLRMGTLTCIEAIWMDRSSWHKAPSIDSRTGGVIWGQKNIIEWTDWVKWCPGTQGTPPILGTGDLFLLPKKVSDCRFNHRGYGKTFPNLRIFISANSGPNKTARLRRTAMQRKNRGVDWGNRRKRWSEGREKLILRAPGFSLCITHRVLTVKINLMPLGVIDSLHLCTFRNSHLESRCNHQINPLIFFYLGNSSSFLLLHASFWLCWVPKLEFSAYISILCWNRCEQQDSQSK